MALLFQKTARLQKAVSLTNNLDSAKFPLLLSRITQKLHSRDERAFTEEEEEKLESAFGLKAEDLHIVLETAAFILEQAAYHNAKPGVFQQQLQNVGLTNDKIKVFVESWTTNGKTVVDKLRQRSLAPKKLEGVDWRLNLQMAQANMAKMKLPNAMVELKLSSGNQNSEKVHLEFTHEELYAFYNQLETIQSQLDSLR